MATRYRLCSELAKNGSCSANNTRTHASTILSPRLGSWQWNAHGKAAAGGPPPCPAGGACQAAAALACWPCLLTGAAQLLQLAALDIFAAGPSSSLRQDNCKHLKSTHQSSPGRVDQPLQVFCLLSNIREKAAPTCSSPSRPRTSSRAALLAPSCAASICRTKAPPSSYSAWQCVMQVAASDQLCRTGECKAGGWKVSPLASYWNLGVGPRLQYLCHAFAGMLDRSEAGRDPDVNCIAAEAVAAALFGKTGSDHNRPDSDSDQPPEACKAFAQLHINT